MFAKNQTEILNLKKTYECTFSFVVISQTLFCKLRERAIVLQACDGKDQTYKIRLDEEQSFLLQEMLFFYW